MGCDSHLPISILSAIVVARRGRKKSNLHIEFSPWNCDDDQFQFLPLLSRSIGESFYSPSQVSTSSRVTKYRHKTMRGSVLRKLELNDVSGAIHLHGKSQRERRADDKYRQINNNNRRWWWWCREEIIICSYNSRLVGWLRLFRRRRHLHRKYWFIAICIYANYVNCVLLVADWLVGGGNCPLVCCEMWFISSSPQKGKPSHSIRFYCWSVAICYNLHCHCRLVDWIVESEANHPPTKNNEIVDIVI